MMKFTFCVYSLLALFLVLCAHVLHRQFRRGVVLFFSAISVFLATWLVLEQDVSNIVPWFRYSWQIAVGYADALAFPPDWSALVLALFIWVGLLSLLVLHLRSVPAVLPEMPRVLLIVAGVFFAWKEGFVQAEEYHLGVFFVWASLTAAAMPVLLPADCERPRRFLSVTLLTLGCAMASFFGPEEGYLSAIRDGAGQRFKDTFSAVFTPVHYKHQLEVHLDSRRNTARLPDIAAIAGDSSMAVLSYYQDVAILNGFNYKPHPVFQNYSAYTPDLQKLNAAFYASTNLPDFVLWPYLTVGNRFPSLDDGIIILSVLNHYIPVRYEKSHVLWQRRTNSAASFHLIPDAEGNVALDEWIPIPRQATWLTVEMQHTWHEQLKAFFFQPSFPAIEVQLEDGTTRTFFLMRGYARSGFVVNPLLAIAPDLVLPALNRGRPMRVVAARIFARNGRFRNTIHYTTSIIEGVPALDAPLPSSDAQPFPDLAPATAPSRPQ